jgi:hypothetical protein
MVPTKLEMFIRELKEAMRDEGECIEEVITCVCKGEKVKLNELVEIPKCLYVYTDATVYTYVEGWMSAPRNP